MKADFCSPPGHSWHCECVVHMDLECDKSSVFNRWDRDVANECTYHDACCSGYVVFYRLA
jgi:hypothetical protein